MTQKLLMDWKHAIKKQGACSYYLALLKLAKKITESFNNIFKSKCYVANKKYQSKQEI